MKKLLGMILILLLMLPACVLAGGSCAVTYDSVATNMQAITWTWTGDATNGSVPATACDSIDGYVIMAITNPGTPAPTNDYDIALNDADGIDVMGGKLADRDTAGSEQAIPLLADTAHYGNRWVSGTLTMAITNQSVASAEGALTVYVFNPEIRR